MNRRFATLALTAAIVSGAGTVQAQIAPAGTFGSLPANSFGGTGIPTNAVMTGGANGATIGLSATQRYDSPPLTNNGAGTFYATPGISISTTHVNTGFAAWNFDYFVGNHNTTDVFTLYIDGNPAVGNSLGDPTTNAFVIGTLPSAYFDSSNFGYGWTFPTAFNPNTQGQYSFALYQRSATGEVLSHVAMNVDVGTVPEPSSVALLGSGFVGLAGFIKRRGKLV
jgi:hypothetical protein